MRSSSSRSSRRWRCAAIARRPYSTNEPGSTRSATFSRAVRPPAAWRRATASGRAASSVRRRRSSSSRRSARASACGSAAPASAVPATAGVRSGSSSSDTGRSSQSPPSREWIPCSRIARKHSLFAAVHTTGAVGLRAPRAAAGAAARTRSCARAKEGAHDFAGARDGPAAGGDRRNRGHGRHPHVGVRAPRLLDRRRARPGTQGGGHPPEPARRGRGVLGGPGVADTRRASGAGRGGARSTAGVRRAGVLLPPLPRAGGRGGRRLAPGGAGPGRPRPRSPRRAAGRGRARAGDGRSAVADRRPREARGAAHRGGPRVVSGGTLGHRARGVCVRGRSGLVEAGADNGRGVAARRGRPRHRRRPLTAPHHAHAARRVPVRGLSHRRGRVRWRAPVERRRRAPAPEHRRHRRARRPPRGQPLGNPALSEGCCDSYDRAAHTPMRW